MSAEPGTATTVRIVKPMTFLLGFVLGLLALSYLGRVVWRRDYHRDFVRFHQGIALEGSYYPCIDEMCSIVRARCRPDQVLVIVGGNSIFYGVGQPADKLWTKELQRVLGDKFVVINFAFRGAAATDGAAVVAEVLRDEYPRQIYVANIGAAQSANNIGSEPYRFLFWEAYYRGLLLDTVGRRQAVGNLFAELQRQAARIEIPLAGRLNRALRFRDVWTWMGYEKFFTMASIMAPGLPGLLWSRGKFRDAELDFADIPWEKRFSPAMRDTELKVVENSTSITYERAAQGWKMDAAALASHRYFMRDAFPDALKRRTLMVVCAHSPYYVRQLSAAAQSREAQAHRDSVAEWEAAGYASLSYHGMVSQADFGDRTHLTVAGGQKLAALVAQKVRAMTTQLGYLPPAGGIP